MSGNMTFINNSAAKVAGGMLVATSNVTMKDVLFSGNRATSVGQSQSQAGGLNADASNIVITGTASFINNSAIIGGGIVVEKEGTLSVTGYLTLSMNSAEVGGGGLALSGSELVVFGQVLLSNNQVIGGNNMQNEGGGMFLESSIVTNHGTISLTNNSANSGQGGGMVLKMPSYLALAGKIHFKKKQCGDRRSYLCVRHY